MYIFPYKAVFSVAEWSRSVKEHTGGIYQFKKEQIKSRGPVAQSV